MRRRRRSRGCHQHFGTCEKKKNTSRARMSHGERALIRLTGIHCRERTQTRMRSRALEVSQCCRLLNVRMFTARNRRRPNQVILPLILFAHSVLFFFLRALCLRVRAHACLRVCVVRKVSALLMQLIFPRSRREGGGSEGKKNKIKQTEQQDFDGWRGETLTSK